MVRLADVPQAIVHFQLQPDLVLRGSAVIALLAAAWFCERAFNFKLLPF